MDGRLIARLAALCVSFCLLLYGGIYIFNDIADVRSDAAHPQKRQRPIAAGRISIARAAVAATALIGSGFATAALFLPFPVIGGSVLALGLNKP